MALWFPVTLCGSVFRPSEREALPCHLSLSRVRHHLMSTVTVKITLVVRLTCKCVPGFCSISYFIMYSFCGLYVQIFPKNFC